MGIRRRIGRAAIGAFCASVFGVLLGACGVVVVALLFSGPPPAGGDLFADIARSIVMFGVVGFVVVVPFALPVGAIVWYVLDRRGLTPGVGALTGALVGMFAALPMVGQYAPLGLLSGALAGYLSVRLTDLLLHAKTDG